MSALAGRVALVAGAGRNIGRAIALALARDGAAVVVNGRSDRAAIAAVAGEIAIFRAALDAALGRRDRMSGGPWRHQCRCGSAATGWLP